MNITGKSHKPYDDEFKTQAVEMLLDSQKPLKAFARDLGVSDTSLRDWKRRYLGQTASSSPEKKYTPEYLSEEVERLRKKNEKF